MNYISLAILLLLYGIQYFIGRRENKLLGAIIPAFFVLLALYAGLVIKSGQKTLIMIVFAIGTVYIWRNGRTIAHQEKEERDKP